MKKEEKQLFKSLCSFKSTDFDNELIQYATPSVLGQLFYNRMQGVAYGTMVKHGILDKFGREFRKSLEGAYLRNIEANSNFFWCIRYLNRILFECDCKYAMLKGAFLCRYYPEGYRTSNDIDLLVLPSDVSKIGNVLIENGFKQGRIKNGVFEPAQRKEIIESKMLRGETVPYIKEINLPYMKFLEVDINFSLDYKNNEKGVLESILDKVTVKSVYDVDIPMLDTRDFIIHLCSHLYKEATTLPWIEMKRDMTLYKYCDIYSLFVDMKRESIKAIFERAKELGMEEVCAFAILQMSQLFDFENNDAIKIAQCVLKDNQDMLHRVVSPKDKTILAYTEKDIAERFFFDKRVDLLRQVIDYEKT